MNGYLITAIVFAILAAVGIAVLIHRRSDPAAKVEVVSSISSSLGKVVSGAVASHVRMLGEDMKSHVDSWGKAIRTDIANTTSKTPQQHAADALSEMAGDTAAQFGAPVQHADGMTTISRSPNPAAVAASIAVPPPAAAPTEPSAGSGGTAKAVDTVMSKSADGKTLTITTQAPYVPNPLSNTPDWRRWTDTSPEGYPVIYGLGGDGLPVVDAAGHAMSALLYDGKTFPDAAAIAAYKEGVAKNAGASAARDAAEASRVLTGPVPVASLTDEDKKYLWWRVRQPGAINWYVNVLGGSWIDVRNALTWVDNVPGPGIMQAFDPAAYTGVLKQYA